MMLMKPFFILSLNSLPLLLSGRRGCRRGCGCVTISVEEAHEKFRITMKAGNLSYTEVEWQLEDETACQAVIAVLVSDPILVMENRAILGSIEEIGRAHV